MYITFFFFFFVYLVPHLNFYAQFFSTFSTSTFSYLSLLVPHTYVMWNINLFLLSSPDLLFILVIWYIHLFWGVFSSHTLAFFLSLNCLLSLFLHYSHSHLCSRLFILVSYFACPSILGYYLISQPFSPPNCLLLSFSHFSSPSHPCNRLFILVSAFLLVHLLQRTPSS